MTEHETTPLLHDNAKPSSSYTVPDTDDQESPNQGARQLENGQSEVREGRNQALSVLFPVGLSVFMAAMDNTIVTSSYAAIGSDLKQLQSTSWLATGYMLTLTSFQPLYGKLSDIFGRKSCLIFAHIIFGLGCLGCGLARTMPELIAARIFAGIGGGGLTTVVSILISDLVPLRQRGTWQGILNIIFSAGSSSGAPLGGIFADKFSWRWSFLIQVPITAIATVIIIIALHPPTRETESQGHKTTLRNKLRRIDSLGALTLVTAVFTLLFGLDMGSNVSWTARTCYIPLIISLFSTILFGIIETTPSLAKEPFAPKRIIANISLIGSYLVNFFVIAVGFGGLFQFALYAQAVKQKTSSQVGIHLLLPILAGVSGSLISGVIMQKTGKYKMMTVSTLGLLLAACLATDVIVHFQWGMIGMMFGKFIYVDLKEQKEARLMDLSVLAQACINFSVGLTLTTTLVALIANVASEDQAIATAVSYLFRSLGGVIGISAGSAVTQQILRTVLKSHLAGGNYNVEEIIQGVRESLAYIDTLDPVVRDIVRNSYARALLSAYEVMTALAVLSILSSFLVKEKPLDADTSK